MIRQSPSTLRTALSALFALVLCCAGSAFAAPIPGGTTVYGILSTDLNSKNVNPGDGFSLTVTRPFPNGDASYANARITGHVTDVVRAGQGTKAHIGLAFDRIFLTNGTSAPISGRVVKVDVQHANSTTQKAVGAGVGMVVGNILGKAIGTNLGGLIGAGGGFLYANNLKTNITIPQGSVVSLQLNRSVVPGARQSGR
jgi:hypothetical protein